MILRNFWIGKNKKLYIRIPMVHRVIEINLKRVE